MKRDFKRLGLMLDMSRNSVMNLPALKKMMERMAKMGYNTLLLYTEDTYEIPEEPYFGHFRGRYSQEELRELVAFGEGLGIEMIPCIQTLAHLNAIFRWPRFEAIHDTADILLAENEGTYDFIRSMLRSVKACFSSPLVHIGMDEAHLVGLGKYLDQNGFQNRFDILSRHLKKVCEMVREEGLEPIIWGDMFFRLANHGQYYNVEEPVVPSPEELNLPEGVQITYWDYYTTRQDRFEKMIRAHRRLERPLWYAGGIWTWKGFAPDNQFSRRSTLAAVRACREEGVENIFFTLWGDDGGECMREMTLSSLFATARFAQGVEDLDVIAREFEEEFDIPFEAFDLLDMHEPVEGEWAKDCVTNPEKYLLFNDPFLGACDSTLLGNEGEYYKSLAEALSQYAEHKEFGPLFRAQALLATALSRKASLGVDTRRIYRLGDKQALSSMVPESLMNRYDICIKDISLYLTAFRKIWFSENKPHGFEVQEIRLGGLIQRMLSCRERLKEWRKNGTEIPELEEDILDLKGGGAELSPGHLRYPFWGKSASVNVIGRS